jgi:putative hydrolase of the HAD superfamily
MKIRAVLFDYGMVLSQPAQPAAHAELLAISGIDHDKFEELYWKYRMDYDRATLDKVSYWETIARDAGTKFTPEQIDALNAADIRMWTGLDDAMVRWVQQLQRSGWKTGILSNICSTLVEWMLQNFLWLKGFTHCCWSCELKLVKPEREIFVRTVTALGVKPEEVLFLDDREENVEGAKAAGLHAIQFTTLEALTPKLAEYGVPGPKNHD